MHETTAAASTFHMVLAALIFVITYVVIMTERVNRAIVALLAAGVMILFGVINQEAAIRGIDFNTIGLLIGMMVIVAITRQSGVFQYVAIWSAKKVNASPWGILAMLSVVTAVVSALLDNVTTVLLIVPVALLITEELKVKAYPYLFSMIVSSNIGGTATLIGDPPNIMIGSAVNLTFNDFVVNLAPVVVVVLIANLIPIYLIWGRHLKAAPEDRQRVMDFNERGAITDPALLKKCLAVIGVVVLSFVFARFLGLEAATIGLFGAAALLLLQCWPHGADEQSKLVTNAFTETEWITIFLLRRAVYRGAWPGQHRLAQTAGRPFAGADRRRAENYDHDHPVVLGGAVGVCGQHSVRRHHDPAD